MTTLAPICKELIVNASQERCFRMFTAGIDKWWPRDHHIGKAPLKEVLIEPRAGGRWYSVHMDDSQTDVGRVVIWEPSTRLVLTWQITAKWQFDPNFETEVELRFIREGDKQTRVKLEHRKLEAYGADAEAMHKTFSSDDAWVRTLVQFANSTQEAA